MENKDNSEMLRMLSFLLNPFFHSGLSKKKISKKVEKSPTRNFLNFWELVDYLREHNTGTDEDIANISSFLSRQPKEMAEFYQAILTKTYRLGCDAKTVNKALGYNHIPQWEVQQAYSFQDYNLQENEWFSLSQKLNGVRGTYFNGKILSRQGKEFSGLQHILSDINELETLFKHYVFDGELVRKNNDGVSDNENFRIGTGILNQDEADKTQMRFVIFDLPPSEEFIKGESSLSYKERRKILLQLKKFISTANLKNILVVDLLYEGSDKSCIKPLLDKLITEDKEGMMLNRDSKYYCRRHSGILKVKQFYTLDLEIIGTEEGTGRLSGKLGALIVDYKGNQLRVGSGFTDDQRNYFWEHRGDLIGRIVEVKYKEERYDKKTKLKSLQFPVFITIREEGKVISYS